MTAAAALTLAPARAFEALELAQLSRELVEDGEPRLWTPRRLTLCIRDPDQVVLVARSGPYIVGFAVMVFAARSAHLSLLAVAPRWRRHGIGRRLLTWLEQTADVAGIEWIDLEVHPAHIDAQRFCAALGYSRSTEVADYCAESATSVRMRRQLRDQAPA